MQFYKLMNLEEHDSSKPVKIKIGQDSLIFILFDNGEYPIFT